MNIDQSSFDVWLQSDVTKVLFDMCKQTLEINQEKILRNTDFTSKAFCMEAFYKGGISSIVELVLDFNFDEIEVYLESKEEVENAE